MNLPRAPKRMRAPSPPYALLARLVQRVGMLVRRPRLIAQPLQSPRLIPLQPLVARLARHPKVIAQLRQRPVLTVPLFDKTKSFFQHIGPIPGHSSSMNSALKKCLRCARHVLYSMCPVCTVNAARRSACATVYYAAIAEGLRVTLPAGALTWNR